MSLKATIEAAQQYLAPQKVDCVVYHYPCNDGAGAALSAWLALGTKANYLPLCYEETFIETHLHSKNVVLLDCSFKKEQLERVRAIAHKVLILDHHDSAMKDLSGEPGCFFHMHNSGAILAWHYFHGVNTQAPKILQLIEDRDLWCWNHRPLSEPLFYALIDRHPEINFRHYEQYLEQERLEEAIAYGNSLIIKNNLWCAQAALKAEPKTFSLPGSNVIYTIMSQPLESDKLVSELAEYLYNSNNVDFIMLWYPLSDGRYKISFRTNRVDINLGEIAKALGGGGHRAAAGAVLTGSPLNLVRDR